MRRHLFVVVSALLVLVAACAPGGGSPSTTTPTTVPTGPREEVEPNGTVAEATLIAVDLEGVSATGSILDESDSDVFAFDLPGRRGVQVVVSGTSNGVCDPLHPAPDAQLLDADSRPVGFQVSGGDGCTRIMPSTDPGAGSLPPGRQLLRLTVASGVDGTTALRVHGRSAAAAAQVPTGEYSVTVSTGPAGGEVEPNDDLASATPLPVSVVHWPGAIEGDGDDLEGSDFYAVDLPAFTYGWEVVLYPTAPERPCDYRDWNPDATYVSLDVLAADGSVLRSFGRAPCIHVSPPWGRSGRHYLRVQASAGTHYRVEVRAFLDPDATATTESEPNDERTDADPVTPTLLPPGLNAPEGQARGTLLAADADSFSIDVASTSFLIAQVSVEQCRTFFIELLDGQGVALPTTPILGCAGSVGSTDLVPAGRYTIRLQGDPGEYRLRIGYRFVDAVFDTASASEFDVGFRIMPEDMMVSSNSAVVLLRNRSEQQVAVDLYGSGCFETDFWLGLHFDDIWAPWTGDVQGSCGDDGLTPSEPVPPGDHLISVLGSGKSDPGRYQRSYLQPAHARLYAGSGMVTTTTTSTTTSTSTSTTEPQSTTTSTWTVPPGP